MNELNGQKATIYCYCENHKQENFNCKETFWENMWHHGLLCAHHSNNFRRKDKSVIFCPFGWSWKCPCTVLACKAKTHFSVFPESNPEVQVFRSFSSSALRHLLFSSHRLVNYHHPKKAIKTNAYFPSELIKLNEKEPNFHEFPALYATLLLVFE